MAIHGRRRKRAERLDRYHLARQIGDQVKGDGRAAYGLDRRSTNAYSAQVTCAIDKPHNDIAADHIGLIEAAWLLGESPIAREGLIEQLKQQGAVYTVMANENNCIVAVVLENEAQRVGAPRNQILQ